MGKSKSGFTLVELLIVIVVIAILAAITLVSYNNITQRANTSAIQSNLAQAATFLASYNAVNGNYPADLATAQAAGLKVSNGTTLLYQYNYDGLGSNDYCLTAIHGTTIYGITDTVTVPATTTGCTLSGIVGWWKLNGDLTDASGNGLTGTNNGATSAPGQNGQANSAYAFNASSIALPNAPSLKLNSSSLSLSAWVYLSSTPSSIWNDIIAGSPSDWGIGIDDIGTSGYLRMTDVSQTDGPNSTTAITLNAWHHVVVTYSTSTHLVSYYLDGATDGAGTWSGLATNFAFTPSQKTMGSRTNTPTPATTYFHGSLDDVRLYNRLLSAQEVSALYTMGAQ